MSAPAAVRGRSRPDVRGLSRATKVALIEGARTAFPHMTDRQRASLIGLSLSAYRNLRNDPDGSKQAARRAGYRGVCEVCGGETQSDGTSKPSPHCGACSQIIQHQERRWKPEAILVSFREFARVMGRNPTPNDVPSFAFSASQRSLMSDERLAEVARAVGLGLALPTYNTVRSAFGSWPKAVEAAGLAATPTGRPAWRCVVGRDGSARVSQTPQTSRKQRRAREACVRAADGDPDFVCPDCGDWTRVLVERTGFCWSCTQEQAT